MFLKRGPEWGVSENTGGVEMAESLAVMEDLRSLATGVVGGNTINCDSAAEVGTIATQKILYKTFGDIYLHSTDKVLPMSSVMNSAKVREELIPVNTMQLFNRIVV